MSDPVRPVPGETLADAGQLYISLAAARTFAEAAGLQHEEARRTLTELLLDARPAGTTTHGRVRWRARSRRTGWDLEAHVVREGRLVVVTHVSARRVTRRAPRVRED